MREGNKLILYKQIILGEWREGKKLKWSD